MIAFSLSALATATLVLWSEEPLLFLMFAIGLLLVAFKLAAKALTRSVTHPLPSFSPVLTEDQIKQQHNTFKRSA